MKPISKAMIITGTAILFLICVVIGALYYRNLHRNDNEMAVSMERNLKEYLNERVNAIEPQILEEKMDSEQVLELIDYLVNEKYKNDWYSQWIKQAENTFVKREQYAVIGEELMAALKLELLNQLEEKMAEINARLDDLTVDDKTGLRIQSLENGMKAMQEWMGKLEDLLEAMKTESTGAGADIENINQTIVGVKKKISDIQNKIQNMEKTLEGIRANVNVKVEKWDADTATLYLVPVK